ncbi:MAG: hypothetical protein AB1611_21115 [bacterium]
MMKTRKGPSPLFFNGLFLVIAGVGMAGLSLTGLPGSWWLSLIWMVWVLANYLFLVRIRVCRYCSFYGHRCPMGWGKAVPRLVTRGCPDKFASRKWPLVYFFSFALLPQLLIAVSLIRTWNLLLACLAVLFGLLGFLLFGLARTFCCPSCSMEPSCFLSRLTPCRGSRTID